MSNTRRLVHCQSGQGMSEYAIILIVIAIACLVIVNTFGGTLKEKFTQANDSFSSMQVDPGLGGN